MKSAVVTGCSSGLGLSVARQLSDQYKIISIGRNKPALLSNHLQHDFNDPHQLSESLSFASSFIFSDVSLCILNAACLEIKKISDVNPLELQDQLKLNVGASKVVIDHIISSSLQNQITFVAISSGASKRAMPGWSSYCISKSTLNMLIECYALEHPEHLFFSIDPGVIKTNMQVRIKKASCSFPETLDIVGDYERMPTPEKVSKIFVDKLKGLHNFRSGSYLRLGEL